MIKKFKIFSLYFLIFIGLTSISFSTLTDGGTCYGSMSFDGTSLHCSEDKIRLYNGAEEIEDRTLICECSTYTPSIAGVYQCIEEPEWYWPSPLDGEDVKGGCGLTLTSTPSPPPPQSPNPYPTPTLGCDTGGGVIIPYGEYKPYFKYPDVPAWKNCEDYENQVYCSPSGELMFVLPDYHYDYCYELDPEPCPYNGDIIDLDSSKNYYKFKKIPYGEDCDDSLNLNVVSCSATGLLSNANLVYKFPTCDNEEEWSEGIDLDYDNLLWEIKDDYTIRKIKYDSNNDIFKYYNKDKQYENLIMPTVSTPNKIEISKDSINEEMDVSKILIALNGHKLKKFHGMDDAQIYFNSTYALMNDLNIKKSTTTNPSKTITNVRIDVGANDKENLVIYQIISKDIITKYSQIDFLSDSSSKSFIVDKDPVIGWYFNYSDEDDYVEYELPGDNEGGTIIITQEPILYNNGELVVNYREVNCNADEAYLFDLDDIYDSKLYLPTSNKFYKLCIAHKDYNLITTSTNNPFMHAFNYTNDGKMSFISSLLENVYISAENTTPIYWDMKIQENSPEGNYSCLGSFNKDSQLSNFGDCGDIPDSRIWLHLGDDYFSPNTTFSYPYLAHTLKISFNAIDDRWGSGVKNTYYCIKNETNECSNKHDDFIIIDEAKLVVSCPNKWSCKKELFYYSTDNFGNIEETNYKELDLIEMGSSCQESCLAAPSPNRYFKECNNLNNCDYYNYNEFGVYDNGVYVSKICHYLTQDSWAVFNLTHEIMCPNGPFKKTSYSLEKLDLTGSQCEKISIEKRNVLFNGMSVLMKIIICED